MQSKLMRYISIEYFYCQVKNTFFHYYFNKKVIQFINWLFVQDLMQIMILLFFYLFP
jgi:hypothetical protein